MEMLLNAFLAPLGETYFQKALIGGSIVAIVSAFIVSLKQSWAKIVVRVAGSWVAAMGMLMFGWMFRGQG